MLDLVDCRARHADAPKSFLVPTHAELSELKAGTHCVKLIAAGERFWVFLWEVDGEKLIGTVATDLVNTERHGLDYGDIVNFEKRHICGVAKVA